MKIFRKSIALLVIIGCIVPFMLTSCHGSRGLEEFVIPEALDTTRDITITFWAKNDTNKVQKAIYDKAIEDFEALYPNIHIVAKTSYTDYKKIYNDVISNINTGTTPNVCISYPDHIATYMTGINTMVNLEELIDDPRYGFGGTDVRFDGPSKNEMISKFMEECSVGEGVYCIPFMRSSEACYINKDFVEKLGYEIPEVLTWDFIFEVSSAAMEKNEDGTFKVNGQTTLIPFIYKSTDNMMIQIAEQLDSGYSTDDGEILLFNDTTKDVLLKIYPYAYERSFSTFKISSYPGNFLNAGQCIFAIDSTAGATWMGSEAPLMDIHSDNVVKFETVVKPVPQFDNGRTKMISQGPSLCVFNKADPQEVVASWLFVQFLLTNEVQIGYSQTEGYVPVTTKALESEEYQDYLSKSGIDNDEHYHVKIDATKIVLDNLENTFVTPVFNGSASLREAAGDLIEYVTTAARGKKPVDGAYIDNLYKEITALHRLDSIGGNPEGGKEEIGALPKEAVILLIVLGVAWAGIISVFLITKAKKKKKENK